MSHVSPEHSGRGCPECGELEGHNIDCSLAVRAPTKEFMEAQWKEGDQIAAEAADQICRAYGFNLLSIQRATALAIIKAAIEEATKEKQATLSRYVVAIDAIYNHNEAARAAVIQFFGIHHIPEALSEPRAAQAGQFNCGYAAYEKPAQASEQEKP